MPGIIEIPIKRNAEDEFVEIDCSNLPLPNECCDLLKFEKSNVGLWITLALEYYRQGDGEALEKLLKEYLATESTNNADPHAAQTPAEDRKGKLRALDILAIYYVRKGKESKSQDKKKDYFAKATALFTQADNLMVLEQHHLLGRAYYCLIEGKTELADAQFNFVLSQQQEHGEPENIPSLLGRACIEFNKKETEGKRTALQLYKKALSLNPKCPADVRLGMGHCFYRLNNVTKAEQAFQRALAVDPRCVGALVGLAIIELNKKTVESMKKGVKMLERAYKIDPNDPMVLIHLANHFFFRRKYAEVLHLARKAFENSDVEAMQAESCYQMARAYHLREQYDEAFEFYYKATQFSSSQFILPQYGLGQMYIHRGELELATQCFENVLKVSPNNYESMKILGSLYAQTSSQTKREQALNYFKKVTEQNPDDVEAWIELASISEQKDTQMALSAYKTAIQKLEAIEGGSVPPEIYNNIAALLFANKNLTEAENYYNLALKQCEEGMSKNEQYYGCIIYTIRYNLGRLYESLYQQDEAEKVYKDILKKHPNYIDCYLRLGCMDRNRGHIFDASDRFKEALRVDPDHADAWSLIGNLHLTKQEWGPSQKKFERILEKNKQNPDIYSLIAMGNVWLQNLYQPIKDKEKLKRQRERALTFYKAALKHDPRNIWAASGIACVLANKGLLNEARDVFAQVREATADFPDVWVNIAHIYVEQKQYVAAVQMYENCLKKFYSHPNTDIMLYIARAYYKANKLEECKNTLLQARHVCPHDIVILYNLAIVLKKLASHRFRDTKSSLRTVLMSVDELGLAHKYFVYLHSTGDKSKLDLTSAAREVRECQDLLSQATFFVTRARKMDEDEKERRRQHEEQLALSKASKEEEERLREEEERRRKEEMEAKRKEIIRKQEETKHKIAEEPIDDRPSKKRKIQRAENDGFVTDASNSADEKLANEERLERQKKKAKKRRISEEKKPKKSGGQRRSRGESSSAKKSSSSKNFKSKEIVSSSEEDSDAGPDADSDDDERPTKSLVIAESSKSRVDDSDSEVERSSDDQKDYHSDSDDDAKDDDDSDSGDSDASEAAEKKDDEEEKDDDDDEKDDDDDEKDDDDEEEKDDSRE